MKSSFIIFLADAISLLLVLLYPSQATLGSLLGVFVINGVNLSINWPKNNNKIVKALNLIVFVYIAFAVGLLFFILVSSEIIKSGEEYFILWKEEIIFLSGKKFPYLIFFFGAVVIGLSLQIANLIKSVVPRFGVKSWFEQTDSIIN